jgi:translation initiation factor IF-1
MPKEELLEFEGVVTEVLPEARFRVKLPNDHEVIAYTAGRMKKNRIRTLVGDRVTVEVSPYDLGKGRVIFRHKDAADRPPRTDAPRKFPKRRYEQRVRTKKKGVVAGPRPFSRNYVGCLIRRGPAPWRSWQTSRPSVSSPPAVTVPGSTPPSVR